MCFEIDFHAVKAAAPVRVRSRLVLDALILAALDPAVRAIESIATVDVDGETVALDAIVLTREDGRVVLEIPEAAALRDMDDEGLALLALERLGLPSRVMTAAEIAERPRIDNARLVWSRRGERVPVEARIRILAALAEGPLTLAEAAEAAAHWCRSPVACVLALACADLIAIDIAGGPLGPETPVRRHRTTPAGG